jgi:hypothetical protein
MTANHPWWSLGSFPNKSLATREPSIPNPPGGPALNLPRAVPCPPPAHALGGRRLARHPLFAAAPSIPAPPSVSLALRGIARFSALFRFVPLNQKKVPGTNPQQLTRIPSRKARASASLQSTPSSQTHDKHRINTINTPKTHDKHTLNRPQTHVNLLIINPLQPNPAPGTFFGVFASSLCLLPPTPSPVDHHFRSHPAADSRLQILAIGREITVFQGPGPFEPCPVAT